MKLCDLVEIIENNMNCVVLKVKDDSRLELIKLGYFSGNEDIIRLTKGDVHTCTIINKDGTNYDWYWGKGGYLLVSDNMTKKGHLIEECIKEDFDIYIDEDKNMIKETLHIKSLDDVKNNHHIIKLMYWNKFDDNICVHKDNHYYKHFSNIKEVKNHFKSLNYEMSKKDEYIAKTGCIVEEYLISKNKENQYTTNENLDNINTTGEYEI